MIQLAKTKSMGRPVKVSTTVVIVVGKTVGLLAADIALVVMLVILA